MVTADIPGFRNILNLTQLVARPRLGRKTSQSCPAFPSDGSHLSGCPKDNLVLPPTPPQGVGGLSPAACPNCSDGLSTSTSCLAVN